MILWSQLGPIWPRSRRSKNHSLTWPLSASRSVYGRWASWLAFMASHRMIVGTLGPLGQRGMVPHWKDSSRLGDGATFKHHCVISRTARSRTRASYWNDRTIIVTSSRKTQLYTRLKGRERTMAAFDVQETYQPMTGDISIQEVRRG